MSVVPIVPAVCDGLIFTTFKSNSETCSIRSPLSFLWNSRVVVILPLSTYVKNIQTNFKAKKIVATRNYDGSCIFECQEFNTENKECEN